MEYIKDEHIYKYPCGDFNRYFRWNVPAFTEGYEQNTGYIVQHIFRKTKDTKKQYSGEEFNHKYWETWPVLNGRINLPLTDYNAAKDFDDNWTSHLPKNWDYKADVGREDHLRTCVDKRKNSLGIVSMEGYVYWAPLGSDFFNVVHATFHDNHDIKWAGNLPATWEVPDYQRYLDRLVFHHSFSNSWSIDDSSEVEQLITPIDYSGCGLTEYLNTPYGKIRRYIC